MYALYLLPITCASREPGAPRRPRGARTVVVRGSSVRALHGAAAEPARLARTSKAHTLPQVKHRIGMIMATGGGGGEAEDDECVGALPPFFSPTRATDVIATNAHTFQRLAPPPAPPAGAPHSSAWQSVSVCACQGGCAGASSGGGSGRRRRAVAAPSRRSSSPCSPARARGPSSRASSRTATRPSSGVSATEVRAEQALAGSGLECACDWVRSDDPRLRRPLCLRSVAGDGGVAPGRGQVPGPGSQRGLRRHPRPLRGARRHLRA